MVIQRLNQVIVSRKDGNNFMNSYDLNNNELINITGGAITASYLNSLSRFGEFVYNVGKALGSSIARLFGKRYC